MFWSKDVGGHSNCPECGRALASEYHTYVLAVRDRGETELALAGNDDGYFCESCPVVVLDSDAFARLALLSLGRQSSGRFTVLGIVDLQAVPEDQRSAPFDEDDNPIPLVKFIDRPSPPTMHGRANKGRAKRVRSQRRRRRRR